VMAKMMVTPSKVETMAETRRRKKRRRRKKKTSRRISSPSSRKVCTQSTALVV